MRPLKLLAAAAGLALVAGCVAHQDTQPAHEDGTYRGGFYDRGDIQMVVQFTLEDEVITRANFRRLYHGGINYLNTEDATRQGIASQYQELLAAGIGQPIDAFIPQLYSPAELVTDQAEVDGFTAATLRSNKLVSSMRDALNRGVYSY